MMFMILSLVATIAIQGFTFGMLLSTYLKYCKDEGDKE